MQIMQYLSCVHPRVCMCNYQNPGLDVITALHVLDRTASGEKIRTGTVARCPMCACVQFLFKSELLGRLPVTSKAGQNQATRSSLSLTHRHTHVHTQTLISVFDAAGDFYCVCQNQKMRTKSPELTESMENTLDSRLYVHTAAICAHVNVKLIV